MKLDVEGAELPILNSVKNYGKIRTISLEYHHSHFNFDDSKLENLVSLIRNKGFQSYVLHLGTDKNSALKMLYFWR